MISRLRSGSKKNPPSKEDIINTIDTFKTESDTEESSPECVSNDNNNIKHTDPGDTGSWDFAEFEPQGVSLSNAYSTEWEKLFTQTNYRRLLRSLAMSGNLRSSRFRSVCWKLFLEVLPEDIDKWISKTREWRDKYDDLKNNLIINPRKAVDHPVSDLHLNNPLSQADESPWNRFFQDNELRLTIKQDVIRTYPRIAFFQSNQVRNLMVDVLFIYAKINADLSYRQVLEYLPKSFPEIQFFQNSELQERMIDLLFCYSRSNHVLSYKQGMHELLAPLIFVLHCDHQAFLHASEVDTLGDIVKEVMDPHFLEHDAYAMLCQIMETVEPWYLSKDFMVPKGKDKVTVTPFARPQDLNSSNAIVSKLTRVQDYILKKFDVELHMHLERLDIAPQIYGIRWVRLLFGREFPMQDLLVLWDAIFADGIGFDLVDYIFVSMLLYIRDLLLASDYPQCLNCLMRYPPVGDVHFLIEKARHLREPNHYPRPPNYTYQTVNQHVPKTKNNTKAASAKPRSASQSVTSSFSSFTRKMQGGSRPKTLSMDRQKMYKSSSVPMNLETDLSPASPQYHQEKRGSSASLSQVEDTMFRSAPSASSLARLDLRTNRSTDNSPMSQENGPLSQFATMPRARKKGKKAEKKEDELEGQIGKLQSQVSNRDSMCLYCANKLDVHIASLQHELQQQTLNNEDEILLAIAGIKQVRDVLKGTLKFSQVLLEEGGEGDMHITENHYLAEGTYSSPESDLQNPKHDGKTMKQKHRMFYMSSEENSEAADSPTDGIIKAPPGVSKSSSSKDVELCDYKISGAIVTGHMYGGSGLADFENYRGGRNHSKVLNETTSGSPNPLYKLNSSEDDT